MTTVVKVDRRNPNYTLYIGRAWAGLPASKWANPFHAWKYGLDECLRLYRLHILTSPHLYNALHEIDEQVLGCWCHEEPSDGSKAFCHGDILIQMRKEQMANARGR